MPLVDPLRPRVFGARTSIPPKTTTTTAPFARVGDGGSQGSGEKHSKYRSTMVNFTGSAYLKDGKSGVASSSWKQGIGSVETAWMEFVLHTSDVVDAARPLSKAV